MNDYEETTEDLLDWLFDNTENASALSLEAAPAERIGLMGAESQSRFPGREEATLIGSDAVLQWLFDGPSDARGESAEGRPGSEQLGVAYAIENHYPALYYQGALSGGPAAQDGYWAAEAYEIMALEDIVKLPPATVTAASADVFDKPDAEATKLNTLKRYHSVDELLEKRAVEVEGQKKKKVWWYKIRYKGNKVEKTGWSKAENFSEIVSPDNFKFITPGGTGVTSPFEDLRKAVAGANLESHIARLINYMNLVILPQADVTLANFVRSSFLFALIKTNGDFKKASLLVTAAVRAFKPSQGGNFAWVQRKTATSGFNPATFRDKIWHFFWNAYERFDGASATWLEFKGLAYELKSHGFAKVASFYPFDKDTEEDLIFNKGGVAFANWIKNNQADVTEHVAGTIANKFREIMDKSPDARDLTQAQKDKLLRTLMSEPEVKSEVRRKKYRLYADYAGAHVEAVLEAIKKRNEGEKESLVGEFDDESVLDWLTVGTIAYKPEANASGEAVEQWLMGIENAAPRTSESQAASWTNLSEVFHLMRSLQEQQAPGENRRRTMSEAYEEAEIDNAITLLEESASPAGLMALPSWKNVSDFLRKGLDEVILAAANKWLEVNRPLRNRFPKEPPSNIDGLPTLDWVDRDIVFAQLRKRYDKQHAALTAGEKARGFSRAPEQILGANPSTPVSANYFVIHDTADTRERSDADVSTKDIHLFIGTVGLARSLDWHQAGLGTKIEARRNTCFVHIELINATMDSNQIKNAGADTYPGAELSNERAAGSRFTLQQYDDLANAYIVASIRRGRFLTVTVHKEVDRSAVSRSDVVNNRPIIHYGHNDPTNFDLGYFYELINQKLLLPAGTTYGIEARRINTNNRTGHVNEFINYVLGTDAAANQYGPVRSQNRHPSAPQGNASSPPVKWPGAYLFPPHNASGRAVLNCGNGDWEKGAPSP